MKRDQYLKQFERRRRRVIALVLSGKRTKDIAIALGITRQRVNQIVREYRE